MKTTILFALLCVAPMAYAQSDQQAIDTVRVPAVADRIELPAKTWSMIMTSFDSFKGAYDLSDGRTLYLTSRGNRMFAEVEGLPKTELRGASSNSFVGIDRSIQLNLTRSNDGEVAGEVLLAKAPRTVGVEPQVIRVAFAGH